MITSFFRRLESLRARHRALVHWVSNRTLIIRRLDEFWHSRRVKFASIVIKLHVFAIRETESRQKLYFSARHAHSWQKRTETRRSDRIIQDERLKRGCKCNISPVVGVVSSFRYNFRCEYTSILEFFSTNLVRHNRHVRDYSERVLRRTSQDRNAFTRFWLSRRTKDPGI